MTLWQNWGRSESATPARVVRPSTPDAVVSAIADARRDGLPVKPVGAGHSFTGIAVAPGVQVNMSELSGVLAVDGTRVTLAAGTHLHQLPSLLGPLGLALQNMGDIDAQTISGATSTGTHGTGATFTGLAGQIRGVTLATADGRLLKIDENHEWFDAARLGLGALGVLTDVTVECVPAFKLSAVERPEPLAELLDTWLERASTPDHFEFYWFPHTTTALTKTNTRLPMDAESKPLSAAKRWLDDEFMSNTVFRWVCGLGTAAPSLIPRVNRLASHLTGDRAFTDLSTSVFTTARRVRFREMEYALPAEVVPDVLREIAALIDRRGWHISFPLEVRIAAPDDIWLSTAHGRRTGYIAIHRYFKEDQHEYFRGVEEIFRAYEGRPHWGKIHYQDAESLRKRYPRFDDFLAVRETLDPDRIFANPYLERVLGL